MTTISTFAEARTRCFNADEVMRMVELGVIGEDEPIELLEGELVVVTLQSPEHAFVSDVIAKLLQQVAGDRAFVRHQKPLSAGPTSLPQPDLAVVRGQPRDYAKAHPRGEDTLLAVEISLTSHKLDRAKAAIYAKAGAPLYWLVDVPARSVTVFRAPDPGGVYHDVTVRSERDTIELPALGARWRVADLLG